MQKIRPHYYDRFSCIAGECPDTCCAGWQIVIDEQSLETYAHVPGEFGKRLKNSIDWMEECFGQVDGRCCFLNERNLCEIYGELGPKMLCQTCRNYPRHVEEFEGRREFSLSLSCPVAAKLILTGEEKVEFLMEETPEEEEFEEFDFLLFTKLEDAREWMIEILQEETWSAKEKMRAILFLAKEMQACVDAGTFFEIDDRIESCKKQKWETKNNISGRFRFMKSSVSLFEELEILRSEWKITIEKTKRLYHGEEDYKKIRMAFEEEYIEKNKESFERIQEKLLLFWIYTHFCGAVYDDEIYAKAMLAVFSTLWIEEINMMLWLENERELTEDEMIRTAWRYAREIEHSDPNLIMLDEIFSRDERFEFEKVQEAL